MCCVIVIVNDITQAVYLFIIIIRNLEYRNSMDNLKIQGMFPTSISQISYANEESEFGGYSIAHHKNFEKLPDYQIKINGPQYKQTTEPLMEKRFGNQKLGLLPQLYHEQQQNIPTMPYPSDYNQKTSGYYLNKDTFSQEQILKAFNIIDINNDNVITEDDLIFVLDYIKQDYTIQEVREMITMLAVDGKQVGIEEFRKLGKGDIIPLAKYKNNGTLDRNKGVLMNNLQQNDITQDDPTLLVEYLKAGAISYQKFEQFKKGAKNTAPVSKSTGSSKDKLCSIIPLKSSLEFKARKQQFLSKVTISTVDLLQNYHRGEFHNKETSLSIKKISALLEIPLKQCKQLYPNEQSIDPLLPIVEAIIYSNDPMEQKLEHCFEVIGYQKATITFNELVHMLQLLKSKDESINKKMKAILLSKGLGNEQQIQKSLAFEIVLEEITRLLGV